jgi:hypothetical protein
MVRASATKNEVVEFLTEYPRAMGVLFSMTLLLSQAGGVLASGASNSGP